MFSTMSYSGAGEQFLLTPGHTEFDNEFDQCQLRFLKFFWIHCWEKLFKNTLLFLIGIFIFGVNPPKQKQTYVYGYLHSELQQNSTSSIPPSYPHITY